MPHPYIEDTEVLLLPGQKRPCARCGMPPHNRQHQMPATSPDYHNPTEPIHTGERLKAEGQRAAGEAYGAEVAAKQIDLAIKHLASTRSSFSANDLREIYPDAKPALIGARFSALNRQSYIVHTGQTIPSSDPGTHAHRIGVWEAGPKLRRKAS